MASMKICTDDEYIEVDPNDVGQLEAAMLFKAEHIEAKADPELFVAVAEMLSCLWDSATKRIDVVRCRECKHRGTDYCIFHIKGEPADEELLRKLDNDFCSYGERKEGAD